MELKRVTFKGISRNTDDGLCKDGECMELINAKLNNGSIEPVSRPILVRETNRAYKQIYHHVQAKKYIGLTSDGNIYVMPEDFSTETILSTPDVITHIEFNANLMVAFTNSGMYYYLFKGSGYTFLGQLPELPEIAISKNYDIAIETTEEEILQIDKGHANRYSREERINAVNTIEGYFTKLKKELNQRGYFLDSAMFRIAYRMFDGSYVMHSPIRFIKVAYPHTYLHVHDSYVFQNSPFWYRSTDPENTSGEDETPHGKMDIAVLGFKPSFTYNIPANLEKWKDLIVSIDIFATTGKGYASTEGNTTLDIKESGSDLFNTPLFYRIATISLQGELDYPEQDVSSDILVTGIRLEDDGGTHNKIISDTAYTYNNRLHVANPQSIIFNGYGKDYLYDNSKETLGTGSVEIYTYIATQKGDIIVGKTFNNISIPDSITPYLMYPDYRAYKMIIKVTYGGTFKCKAFNLAKHKSLNAAYSRNNAIEQAMSIGSGRHRTGDPTTTSAESDASYTPEYISDWGSTDISVSVTSNIESREGVMKVSNTNNPFFFPAKQTYQFQYPIVALQSNVTALSQGQYGENPVYVFTKGGIQTMHVDTSGVLAYSSVKSGVTRDVCNNADSVCPLDTAVAFTCDKGLMIIRGIQTQVVSESMYGFLPSCSISSPIIPRILAIAELSDCMDDETFQDYLKEAKIGYNYRQNEIIVGNPSYNFAFVYGLKTNLWHKISVHVDAFVNSYPDTYIQDGTRIWDLNNDRRSVANIGLISRPIKLDSMNLKRIVQTALRGIVKQSQSNLYLRGEPVMFRNEELYIFDKVGMYILGSNDAEHFRLVAKKEMPSDIRDLVTKMNKSLPYKYFIVCLVGGVRSDVSINFIEFTIDESFTNRLR